MSNSLDPDQARQNLGTKCLQDYQQTTKDVMAGTEVSYADCLFLGVFSTTRQLM